MSHVKKSAVAVLVATILVPTIMHAAPVIEATSTGLRASGITKGGTAVWFGATIDTYALARRLKRHVTTTKDDDGDGAVSLDLPSLSPFFVMVVVDHTTGEYGVFHGSAGEGRELDLRGNNWRSGLRDFDVVADFLEILLVRPGEGAWTIRAAEGGYTDGDRVMNGKFRLAVNDMQPLVDESGRPGGVRRNDVLVIINPQTLDYVIRPAKE